MTNARTPAGALMQWLLFVAFVATILLILLPSAQAQTTVDPNGAITAPAEAGGSLADKVVALATTVVVPILLALVKQVLPKLPSWVIPLLAPVLGLLIGLVQQLATNSGNVWVTALLGLAGVGLREVKENLLPANNGGWPSSPKP